MYSVYYWRRRSTSSGCFRRHHAHYLEVIRSLRIRHHVVETRVRVKLQPLVPLSRQSALRSLDPVSWSWARGCTVSGIHDIYTVPSSPSKPLSTSVKSMRYSCLQFFAKLLAAVRYSIVQGRASVRCFRLYHGVYTLARMSRWPQTVFRGFDIRSVVEWQRFIVISALNDLRLLLRRIDKTAYVSKWGARKMIADRQDCKHII